MRRRRFVAVVSSLAVAGCTGSGGDGSERTTGPRSTADGRAVSASSLSVVNSGCGSTNGGGAAVSFEGSEVVVSGTVVGNDGCYRARLGEVSYEASSDTCRVVVEAFDDRESTGGCAQCITEIEYEADVVFDGGVPGTVTVVHDDLGGRKSVASEDS